MTYCWVLFKPPKWHRPDKAHNVCLAENTSFLNVKTDKGLTIFYPFDLSNLVSEKRGNSSFEEKRTNAKASNLPVVVEANITSWWLHIASIAESTREWSMLKPTTAATGNPAMFYRY